MTDHRRSIPSGFSEEKQASYGSIPTDPDAFLLWSSTRPREEGKYELSRGVVQHSMINTTRSHTRVCTNIVVELSRLIDRNVYDIATHDFGVRTLDGIRGPDIVVDRAHTDGTALATSTPIFLAEVLSPSSVARDFTEKFDEYTALDSVQTYLICSQDEPRAWVWQRNSDGSWPRLPTEFSGRDATIEVAGLGISLPMAAVFRGIPDAPTA